MSSNVYPSIDELLPRILSAHVPESLAEIIRERYDTLGEKYLTDAFHFDGRRINACMDKSSIQDALEEVVDAVFNTLVWIFKGDRKNSAYTVLEGLIIIYGVLAAEREHELAIN